MGNRQLDDYDERIIDLLRADGRMSSRDVAARIDLSEATVRARIRRLEQAGVMRVVARLDLAAVGYPFSALVGLKIKGRTIDEVSADLLKLPDVISVLSVIGRNDLEIQVIASSMDDLDVMLNEVIRRIEGVAAVESALALKVHKYIQPWGKFDENAPA